MNQQLGKTESWWWNDDVQKAVKEKKEAWLELKAARREEDWTEAQQRYMELNKLSKERLAITKAAAAAENLFQELERNGLGVETQQIVIQHVARNNMEDVT